MAESFLGQVIRVSFDFAPSGWVKCEGQLLPIDQHTALFNLLGTTYGGNGQTTFALPDLQGRAALGFGQGPALSNYLIGQNGGGETVTLTSQQAALHQHAVSVFAVPATRSAPTDPQLGGIFLVNQGGVPATISGVFSYAPYDSANQTALSPSSIGPNAGGGGQPHENRQPLLAITYCISLYGIYPSRN
jgi:microcystin-dependent protein